MTINEISEATKAYRALQGLRFAIRTGHWEAVKQYKPIKDEITVGSNNITLGSRIIIPDALRQRASRKQKVKVNSSFSTWTKTSLGVPQGSVLGPLSFNIYLNDLFMFLEETEVCNYADDRTIYTCGSNVENLVVQLENDALAISECFPNNRM